MKKIFVLGFCLLLAVPVMAKQQTLAAEGFESGGYGGPIFSYGSVKGNGALFMGGEGGWIANKTFILGGEGWGLISNINANSVHTGSNGKVEVGCGGLKLGVILNSDAITHLVVHTLIGWGSVSYKPANGDATDVSNITIIEPGVDYEVNVAPFFRIALRGTYRIVSGVDSTPGLSNADLSGANIGVVLKFGNFGKE